MKIHQLPLGARFEYEGEEYTKTGPLFAAARSGGQRLIPKYAVVRVLEKGETVAPRQEQGLSREKALAAFEAFYQACRPLVTEDCQGDLAAARENFLRTLG